MLAREEELRLCDETQRAFRAARDPDDPAAGGVFRVVEALQRRVVAEFGITDEGRGLDALRRAELWVGDATARDASLYRRHNRCVDGPLRVGDAAPLAAVPSLRCVRGGDAAAAAALDDDGCGGCYSGVVDLSELAARAAAAPLVLVAGSHS